MPRSPQAAFAPIEGIIDAPDEPSAKRPRKEPFPHPVESDDNVMGADTPGAHDASPSSQPSDDPSSPFPSDEEWEDVTDLPPRAAAVPSGLYTTPLHMRADKPTCTRIQRHVPKQVIQAWPAGRSGVPSRVFHWGRPDRSADNTEDDAAGTAIAWLWDCDASLRPPSVEAAIERIARI